MSSSRISDAFNAAENITSEGRKKDSLEFSLMKSRLEVYYETIPLNALRLYESKVDESPSDRNLYGLALAISTMNKEYKFKYVFPLIGKDFLKMIFGLSVSVGIVLAIHYIIIPNNWF